MPSKNKGIKNKGTLQDPKPPLPSGSYCYQAKKYVYWGCDICLLFVQMRRYFLIYQQIKLYFKFAKISICTEIWIN